MRKPLLPRALALAFAAALAASGALAERTVAWAGRPFAKGADLSRLSELESKGRKFLAEDGLKSDIFPVLRGYSVNAARFRVYLAPDGGWCGTKDTLEKAYRARTAGMDLMVAFQYSDVAAGLGAQTPPRAWDGYGAEDMVIAASNHTAFVLSWMKKWGIEPRWVQIGNETADGMLWPVARLSTCPREYAEVFAACRAAVKSVFPRAMIVLHVGRADDVAAAERCIGTLFDNDLRFDIAGFSLFPERDAQDGEDCDDYMKRCLANVERVSQTWNCETMILETGFENSPRMYEDSRQRLSFLVWSARQMRRCRGVFYYEPECRPRADGSKFGAFDEMGRATPILEGFRE